MLQIDDTLMYIYIRKFKLIQGLLDVDESEWIV